MLIPTLRESPADAEAVSHVYMLRAGYIRQLAAGLYLYLPLAWRVLEKINTIIREEMQLIGAQELSMPALHPSEIWQKTGRWNDIGEEMFRLRDRSGRDLCLGMTHEEVVTWLASREIRSYRELPQVWYQIQTKFRDEARPKSGILRTREFIMKDSYSFDRDEKGLRESYRKHSDAYHRIFERCGLKFYQVESDPGMMGGATAHEFMSPSPAGEDSIALCMKCTYAANIELAQSVPAPQPLSSQEAGWTLEDVATPNKRTVEEVASFLNISPVYFIKSLLFICKDGPFLALMRGDQILHENKLQRIVGDFRAAQKDEVKNILGTEAGFIGPHNNKLRKIADLSLQQGIYISGANKKDFHTRGLRPSVHFEAEWHDLHVVREKDKCHTCGSEITVEKAIEIGNIFQLGTKYSQSLKAVYLDEKGKEIPIVMGSYGIGPARIAAAAIEQNHDEDGIIWPPSISPFDVKIIPLNPDKEVMGKAEHMYQDLKTSGIEVLMDNRNERPGVKFKDADLIGIPVQVIIGGKSLREGYAEIKLRKTKTVEKISMKDVSEKLKNIVHQNKHTLTESH
jgi:prolyl-tRNA synthetase